MMTILLIEDNKEILRYLERLIALHFKHDFQILKAETFFDGKKIIESRLADIFIIDFNLPDGDGLDLIKLIRTHYPRWQPIIVQTVRDDTTYQLDVYKSYGNIVYLTKDIVFEELVEHLANAKEDLKDQTNDRLIISGRSVFEALDTRGICLISKVPNTNNLEVTSYDIRTQDFKYKEIPSMSLDSFLKQHNSSDVFIRCHKSHIVNKKMIEKIDRIDNKVLLKYKNLRVELGDAYKKEILQAMRGLE